MNKNTFWFIMLLFGLAFGFASCEDESPVEDPYANWEERNELYLDSIVKVARNHPANETWEIYKNYKIDVPSTGGIVSPIQLTRYDSVYVKVLRKGDGVIPMATDTVYVAYQGFLMNGVRFDGTYFDKFNPEVVDNFKDFQATDGLIVGWTTALINMNTGTFAEVYIPYQMGYREAGRDVIPGYSVLKFELFLNEVRHPQGPDDRSRKMKVNEMDLN